MMQETSTAILHPPSSILALPTPVPRRDVSIRVATMDDLPFLDAMQKKHGKALGYFPTKQFEGYIEMGGALVAHDGAERLGYVISRDRYLKRDELGVVYQLCVAEGEQRKLVGASLLRAVFERSAYGCKLYCCWCAQDLPANHFWESMGFLPIAFRAGSGKKKKGGRVHIFWQRRINEGDTGEKATPYWYPCATNAGAIREDRLVFPIPPGVHWRDVTAVQVTQAADAPELPAQDHVAAPKRAAGRNKPPVVKPAMRTTAAWRLRFEPVAPAKVGKQNREKVEKPKAKIDPALVSKARELRDRCVEHQDEWLALSTTSGKYEVGRALRSRVARSRTAIASIVAPAA